MMITRDQFIRGFNALVAAHARRDRLNAILAEGNDGHQDVGLDPAIRELERQLEERCRDCEDDQGPWPENSGAEGDISLGLCPTGFMTIRDEHDNVLPHLTTAEAIWDQWEATSTGPFRPERGQVANLDDRRRPIVRPSDPAEDVLTACRRLSNSPSVMMPLEAKIVLSDAADEIEKLRSRLDDIEQEALDRNLI